MKRHLRSKEHRNAAIACGIIAKDADTESSDLTDAYIADLIVRVPAITVDLAELPPLEYEHEGSGICALPAVSGYKCTESGCTGAFTIVGSLFDHYRRIHRVSQTRINVNECKAIVQSKFGIGRHYFAITLPGTNDDLSIDSTPEIDDSTSTLTSKLHEAFAIWDSTPEAVVPTAVSLSDKLNASKFYAMSHFTSTLGKLNGADLINAAQLVLIPRNHELNDDDIRLKEACVGYINRVNSAIRASNGNLRKLIQGADSVVSLEIDSSSESVLTTDNIVGHRRWFFEEVRSVDAYAATIR